MVINTSYKPRKNFSVLQREALHGEDCLDFDKSRPFNDFLELYDGNAVTEVIVDADDDVFVNDVLNAVRCRVVTLEAEHIVDTNKSNFLSYGSKH